MNARVVLVGVLAGLVVLLWACYPNNTWFYSWERGNIGSMTWGNSSGCSYLYQNYAIMSWERLLTSTLYGATGAPRSQSFFQAMNYCATDSNHLMLYVAEDGDTVCPEDIACETSYLDQYKQITQAKISLTSFYHNSTPKMWQQETWSHELGHVVGLADAYQSICDPLNVPLGDGGQAQVQSIMGDLNDTSTTNPCGSQFMWPTGADGLGVICWNYGINLGDKGYKCR